MLKRFLPRLVLIVSLIASLAILSTAPALGAARPDGPSERTTTVKAVERSGGLDVLDAIEALWDRVRSTIRGDKQGPRDSPGSGVDPNGHTHKPGANP
ncbi:MAG: hypothetical protein AAF481_15700 [Acidobacteriota bacterium]